MKILKLSSALTVFVLLALSGRATVHYVSPSATTPLARFTSWATAATNIQNAINVSAAGDTVLVTNGVYQSGSQTFNAPPLFPGTLYSRIKIPAGVTVSSVNGPSVTIIQGATSSPQTACACLLSNAVLSGFTLTNGVANGTTLSAGGNYNSGGFGGGAYCQTTNAVISNCLICNGNANFGGGVYQGTLSNCTLVGNTAGQGGGAFNSILYNCSLIGNMAISSTTAYGAGAFGGVLNNCLVISNNAAGSPGIGGAACSNVLNNCLILYNTASPDQVFVAQGSAFTNCTLCFNTAYPHSDFSEMTLSCTLRNCIMYYNNFQPTGVVKYTGNDVQNCCITPAYGTVPPYATTNYGTNNFTNAPVFVNTNGDFHLQANSPCINAGINTGISTNAVDLDGNPRIAGGTVDIGAYEFQSPTSVISYAWLQQYNLPIDGSADYADTDGDGMNNWQEWVAGTNPTNAASLLKMNQVSNGVAGSTVTWQSVSNILYFVQRSTALPAFTVLHSNIVGLAGSTSYTDTTTTNGSAYYLLLSRRRPALNWQMFRADIQKNNLS